MMMTMTMTMVWVLRRREGTRLLVSVLLVSVRGVVGNDNGKKDIRRIYPSKTIDIESILQWQGLTSATCRFSTLIFLPSIYFEMIDR